MKILDRYLIKNFILPLAYCLFLFCFLYIVIDIFSHLDDILRNKVPLSIILQYYSSFTPLIFVQTSPVASLLAIVYMLSMLNKNNELIAVRACGISVGRLLLPVFATGMVLSLFTFLINENVVPKSIITAEKIKSDYIEMISTERKNLKSIENLTVYGKGNQLIYAKDFNPVDNSLSEIIIFDRDNNQHLHRKILANKGLWNGVEWEFFDCIIYRFDKVGKVIGSALVFDKKVLEFPETPKELLKHEFQMGHMNYKELRNYIGRFSETGNPSMLNSLKTDFYFKTALPFISLIIMLLGIPFALTTRRGGAMSGIGISVLVGLLYYGSIYFSLALGKGGIIPPIVAAHLSNIVFFLIAIGLLRSSRT